MTVMMTMRTDDVDVAAADDDDEPTYPIQGSGVCIDQR